MKILVKAQINVEVDVLPGTDINEAARSKIEGMLAKSVPYHLARLHITPQPTSEQAAAEALRRS